jgi:hypothetical protein
MRWARLGSPGIKTAGAKSPGWALMCGVGMFVGLSVEVRSDVGGSGGGGGSG